MTVPDRSSYLSRGPSRDLTALHFPRRETLVKVFVTSTWFDVLCVTSGCKSATSFGEIPYGRLSRKFNSIINSTAINSYACHTLSINLERCS